MENISFKEDHISQIPALMLLQKLGYKYLTPDEALELRGGRNTNVILEPILRERLKAINTINVSNTKTVDFSDQNIENGIVALKDIPLESGFIGGNEYVYNLLTIGKSFEQSIDGDKKSYNLRYIDWKNVDNNVFHVTEEFAVTRSGSADSYRPDIVLFVNGIPFCIIECKRPDIRDSLKQAISQHLRNQKEYGIRLLYGYSSLLLATSVNEAKYATTGTDSRFWSIWREIPDDDSIKKYRHDLGKLVNTKLSDQQMDSLFSSRFRYVRNYFEEKQKEHIIPTTQDEYLFSLCSPKRLLDLTFNYTLFDNGIKKIARYQQYFAVKSVMNRIRATNDASKRGGVIWHTQGSGKSLTMVLIAQAIALDKTIKNPRLILVTDRTDLDKQITNTFRKCGLYVENATTGKNLIELLESNTDAVITTIVNKFETAFKGVKEPIDDPNIFVLIDEGHRSQNGIMNAQMRLTLPNATFIAMTGTPLMNKEKNTINKFGGLIEPVYTVDQAVDDGAVVPLLYEGRYAYQEVYEKGIDNYFKKISEPLNEYEKADLKRKFSQRDQLNQAELRIKAIAWDISEHFKENWGGSGFKAQLVCPRKVTAIKYKKYLDEIGYVTSEVLITGPDTREGETSAYGTSDDEVKKFWKTMMDEHGSAEKYETNIINRFKNDTYPEIIIVVDKLLTGFDEPKNTIMYLDRSLKNHTLFQAIARVNRIYEGKNFGYIIDYYGVLEDLNKAILDYEYNSDDIQSTYIDISEEIENIPQYHSNLWDIFKTISNKRDMEAYSLLLRSEDIRYEFYDKLTKYSNTLKMALSSISFYKTFSDDDIKMYKEDLQMFLNLRKSVKLRYSDAIDYKDYEYQIQKLIDNHVVSSDVSILTDLVDIFDREEFEKEVEKVTGKAAKADTIASRTLKYITENMDTDPAFYKKFSELIKDTISQYEQKRISEIEYLNKVNTHKNSVLSHTDSSIPKEISNNRTARAYYGLFLETIKDASIYEKYPLDWEQITLETALAIDKIINENTIENGITIIDWQSKSNLIGKIKIEINDYIYDNIIDKYKLGTSFDAFDIIIDSCVNVARSCIK